VSAAQQVRGWLWRAQQQSDLARQRQRDADALRDMADRAEHEACSAESVSAECVDEAARTLALPDEWCLSESDGRWSMTVWFDELGTMIPLETEPQIEALIAALALEGDAQIAAVRALAVDK
jgi:hypothetical protein